MVPIVLKTAFTSRGGRFCRKEREKAVPVHVHSHCRLRMEIVGVLSSGAFFCSQITTKLLHASCVIEGEDDACLRGPNKKEQRKLTQIESRFMKTGKEGRNHRRFASDNVAEWLRCVPDFFFFLNGSSLEVKINCAKI